MKPTTAFLACLCCIQGFACNKNKAITTNINDTSIIDKVTLKITIGSSTFNATFYRNETAAAFKARLPLIIDMKELNGNEKYFDLPNSLPANATNPRTIQTGDLTLYGSNTLVLFYKTFSTSYNYTKLARIENPSGLAEALGAGNITVSFELTE